MDKLDSFCPMVGLAPVEKERSDRHSQGSIYIIFSWIKKFLRMLALSKSGCIGKASKKKSTFFRKKS